MSSLLVGLIPASIFLGMMVMIYGITHLLTQRPRDRRSPLTRQLMRGPGHSLLLKAEDLSLDISACLLVLVTMPLYLYSSYITVRYFSVVPPGALSEFIYAVACIGVVVSFTIKLGRLIKKRRDIRLGLDCEMAVGQELNSLMCDGYKVFHDVPADGFNIDHVVVGGNGVFAVETKGRSKPDRKKGADDATVVYDGDCLRFPDSVQREPLLQARRQAKWLSAWLTSAMAEPVPVLPVLALPGWWIERKKRGDVLLLNGKDYRFIVTQRTGVALGSQLTERISNRLEELCRDVEPKAYWKTSKWVA
jgi:hypothetical protein